MTLCSIKGCGGKKKPGQNITFHRLPRNEPRKSTWLNIIGPHNLRTTTKDIYICSLHFNESSFNRTLGIIRLRDEAVPLPLTIQETTFVSVKHFEEPMKLSATECIASSSKDLTSPIGSVVSELIHYKQTIKYLLTKARDTSIVHKTPISSDVDNSKESTTPQLQPSPAMSIDRENHFKSSLNFNFTETITTPAKGAGPVYTVESINNMKMLKLRERCMFLKKKVKRLNEKIRRQNKKITDNSDLIKKLQEQVLQNSDSIIVLRVLKSSSKAKIQDPLEK